MTVLLGTFAVPGWRLDGLVGAGLVPSIVAVGKLIVIIGLWRRR